MRRGVWIVLAVAAVAACRIDEIDYSGKHCSSADPCPAGWTCSSGGLCASDDDPSRTCRFSVSALTVAWETPNSIHWKWETVGDATQLAEYALEVTEEGADAGAATVWSKTENPELGRVDLPRGSGTIAVLETTTFDHRPDTTYHGVLRAVNKDGCVSRSRAAQTTTGLEPLGEIVIFRDSAQIGYALPEYLRIVPGAGPVSQSTHLEYRPSDDPANLDAGTSIIYENLRWNDLGISQTMTEGQFAAAYLEVYLRYAEGTEAGWWSEMWLVAPNGPGCSDNEECIFGFSPYTVPTTTATGRYRRMQVPLRVLRSHADRTTPLTASRVSAGISGINMTGSSWSIHSTVSFDAVTIKY